MEKRKFILNNENSTINLLDRNDNTNPKGRRIFKISKFIVYLFIILVISFFIFTYQVLFTNNSFVDSFGEKLNFFKQLTTIAKTGNALDGFDQDRINILLLGIGGSGHDGPNLTDTIILVSIKPSTNKISMISIPRDLYTEIPGYGWWKINNAYHFGAQNNNQGGDLTSQVVSEVTGLPIHYYLRVDFSGFEKVIDDLGGIKIYVDRSFTDYQYPTDDHKYQVVSFEEGWQTMDGDTALKFVRSRHGNNGEGSDFARSKRQQKVLQATKDRALSIQTLLNPKKLNKIIKDLDEHIETNLELAEIAELAQMSKELDTQNIINVVLDNGTDGYLYSDMINEAYVLRPRGNDYSQIQFMAQNIFTSQHTISQRQSANLEIKNGTKITGLAFNASQRLKSLGFKVLKIGNAPIQDYNKTIIYNLTDQEDKETSDILTKQLNAEIINEVPDWVKEDADFSTEYYIILGSDQNQS